MPKKQNVFNFGTDEHNASIALTQRTKTLVKEDNTLNVATFMEQAGRLKERTTKTGYYQAGLGDVGIGGASATIQSIDAYVASEVASMGGINVHDAVIVGMGQTQEVFTAQNKTTFEALVSYHAGIAVMDSLVQVVSNLKSDELKTIQQQIRQRLEQEEDKLTINKLSQILEGLDSGRLEALLDEFVAQDLAKLEAMEHIQVMHQYGGELGEYALTAKDYERIKQERLNIQHHAQRIRAKLPKADSIGSISYQGSNTAIAHAVSHSNRFIGKDKDLLELYQNLAQTRSYEPSDVVYINLGADELQSADKDLLDLTDKAINAQATIITTDELLDGYLTGNGYKQIGGSGTWIYAKEIINTNLNTAVLIDDTLNNADIKKHISNDKTLIIKTNQRKSHLQALLAGKNYTGIIVNDLMILSPVKSIKQGANKLLAIEDKEVFGEYYNPQQITPNDTVIINTPERLKQILDKKANVVTSNEGIGNTLLANDYILKEGIYIAPKSPLDKYINTEGTVVLEDLALLGLAKSKNLNIQLPLDSNINEVIGNNYTAINYSGFRLYKPIEPINSTLFRGIQDNSIAKHRVNKYLGVNASSYENAFADMYNQLVYTKNDRVFINYPLEGFDNWVADNQVAINNLMASKASIVINPAKVGKDKSIDEKVGEVFGKPEPKIHYGIRGGLDNLTVEIINITAKDLSFKDTKELADTILRQLQGIDTLYNEDTGWNLSVGKKDRKKMGNNKQLSHATSQAVQEIEQLVNKAVLVETHTDGKHGNPDVKAVYRLYAPAMINGQLHRVKLTIKDYQYTIKGMQDRKNLHAIEAVEIETGLLGTVPPYSTSSDVQVAQPTTSHTISIASLLNGVKTDGDNGVFNIKDPVTSNPDDVFRAVTGSNLNDNKLDNPNQAIQSTDVTTINIASNNKNGYESLSNFAPRAFTGEDGRVYQSVEHAYQTWKTGQFNEQGYKNPMRVKNKGKVKTADDWNIRMLKKAMIKSFEANPSARDLLVSTGTAQLTHKGAGNQFWAEKTAQLLMEVRGYFNQTNDTQVDNSNDNQANAKKDVPNIDLKNHRGKTDIDTLYQVAISRGNGNKSFANLAKLNDKTAQTIKNLIGIDVTGFDISVDESAIRHTLKEHGNEQTEHKRGQTAVTKEDFALTATVVNNADTIKQGDTDKSLVFERKLDNTYVVVQQLRIAKNKLSLKIMYKKGLTSVLVAPDNHQSTAETSVTSESLALDTRVANPTSSVNKVDKRTLSELLKTDNPKHQQLLKQLGDKAIYIYPFSTDKEFGEHNGIVYVNKAKLGKNNSVIDVIQKYAYGLKAQTNKVTDTKTAREVLQGRAVSVVDESVVQVPNGTINQIAKWGNETFFKAWGNKAIHPVLGEVALTERTLKNSLNHGNSFYKKVIIAGLKDIIEKGVVIAQDEVQPTKTSYFVSAPIQIKESNGKVNDNIATVTIHSDMNGKRMYIHSVTLKENLMGGVSSVPDNSGKQLGSTAPSENLPKGVPSTPEGKTSSKHLGSKTSADIRNILHDLIFDKPTDNKNQQDLLQDLLQDTKPTDTHIITNLLAKAHDIQKVHIDYLSKIVKGKVTVEFVDNLHANGGIKANGVYHKGSIQIENSLSDKDKIETYIHEMYHAVTDNQIQDVLKNGQSSKYYKPYNELKKIQKALRDYKNNNRFSEGIKQLLDIITQDDDTGIAELIAYGTSMPAMMEHITHAMAQGAGTKADKGYVSPSKVAALAKRFIGMVSQFFGFNSAEYNSFLTHVNALTSNVISPDSIRLSQAFDDRVQKLVKDINKWGKGKASNNANADVELVSDKLASEGFVIDSKAFDSIYAMLKLATATQGGSIAVHHLNDMHAQLMVELSFDDYSPNQKQLLTDMDMPTFVALALTHNKLADKLTGVRTVAKKSKETWWDKLVNLINAVYIAISGFALANKSNDTYLNQFHNLSAYLAKAQRTVGKENAFDKLVDISNKPIKLADGFVKKTLAEATKDKFDTQAAKRLLTLEQDALNVFDTKDGRALGEMGQFFTELSSKNAIQQLMEKALRLTKAIETKRADINAATQRVLLDNFKTVPRKEQTVAITEALLSTDISVLLDSYEMDKVLELLSQDTKRGQLIRELKEQIRQTAHGNDKLNQADKLAYYLATEHAKAGLVKNAHLIAVNKGLLDNDVDVEPDTDLVNTIESLVSLRALDFVKQEHLQSIKDLINTDPKAVETVLKEHKSLADKGKEDFAFNYYNYAKGYLPQVINPYKSLKSVHPDDVASYEAQGWKVVQDTVIKDKLDNSDTHVLIQHSDINTANYVSAALELSSDHAKGSLVYGERDYKDLHRVAVARHKERLAEAQIDNDDFDVTKLDDALIARYGVDGRLLDYHYEMGKANRDVFLNRNRDGIALLGTLAGQLAFKQQTRKQQANIAKLLYQDYKDNYLKMSKRFVLIDPNSSDPKLQEIWALLPPSFRHEANKLFGYGKPIPIRKEILTMTFGFRQYTLADMFAQDANKVERGVAKILQAMLGRFAYGAVVKTEKHVGNMMKVIKQWIVIGNYKVLMGNTIANIAMLTLMDVPISKVLTGMVDAIRQGKYYDSKHKELLQFNIQIDLGDSSLIAKRNALIKHLQNHPMHKYMQAGIKSTIVEDTIAVNDDYSYKSKTHQQLLDMYNELPSLLREGIDTVLMNPNTPLFKFATQATQYSDFFAKYVLVEHLTSKGESFESAINKAQETFINFDIPTSRGLDYANRMGVLMFTKFFIRFQPAMQKRLIEAPVQSVMHSYMMSQMLDMPHVFEPHMLNHLTLNPLSGSVANAPSAFMDITPMQLMF